MSTNELRRLRHSSASAFALACGLALTACASGATGDATPGGSTSLGAATTAPPVLRATEHANRRVTPEVQLTEQQLEFLKHDPVAWARESVDATRSGKLVDCKTDIPAASDDYCERILQVDGRSGVLFVALQQRFLTGSVTQSEYQAEFHRIFLEHDIALEQFMPAQDFIAHEHHQPGDDSFLDLSNWFLDAPEHLLGDEIFDPSRSRGGLTLARANLPVVHDGMEIAANAQLRQERETESFAARVEPAPMLAYRHQWKEQFLASRAPTLASETRRFILQAEDQWVADTRAARHAFVLGQTNEPDYVATLKASRRALLHAVQQQVRPEEYEALYNWRAGADPFDRAGAVTAPRQ